MAESFFKAKDYVTSKVTPECLKANVEEVKAFTEKNMPKGGDPHAEGGGQKITEYEAAWNVTNAIQVKYYYLIFSFFPLYFLTLPLRGYGF